MVDESYYKDLVEKRRGEENFIIDESGQFGYNDDGEENWEDYDDMYSEEEYENNDAEDVEKKKSKTKAPVQKKKKFKKIDSSFLKAGALNNANNEASSSTIPKKAKKPQDFPMEQLDSLLDDLVSNPTSELVSDERKKKRIKTEDIALFGQTAEVDQAQMRIVWHVLYHKVTDYCALGN